MSGINLMHLTGVLALTCSFCSAVAVGEAVAAVVTAARRRRPAPTRVRVQRRAGHWVQR